MKNWKTTAGGFMGAASIAMCASPDIHVHFAGIGLACFATMWFGWHSPDAK